MTTNYYIKCPVCGCITRMRSPAGYIENTPVRVHCGKCEALLTGYFVSDSKTLTCYFKPTNCTQEEPIEYDFYGEASGEVLSHKICKNMNFSKLVPPFISPAMLNLQNIQLEVNEKYIDFACYISELSSNWDKCRISYDLFTKGQYDTLKIYCAEEAKTIHYTLNNEFDIQRFIHFKYLYDFGMIFGKKKFEDVVIKINYEFYHLNKKQLNEYIQVLINENKLSIAQSKMFSIMNDYIKIALFIMPALSAMQFKEGCIIDKENYGLSTCSFNDIKTFYIDSFETLADCCDIIKCLDNIKYRDGYNDFGTKMTLEKFNNNTKNGNRIKELQRNEFFSEIFNLSGDSNELRNAIGHNDYKYNGLTQALTYVPNKQEPHKIQTVFLIDVAVYCIELMQSSIVLEFLVYELLREFYRDKCDIKLHPMFYKKAQGSNHCPCGSGKKYSQCCKQWVTTNKNIAPKFLLPCKSNMRMTPEIR